MLFQSSKLKDRRSLLPCFSAKRRVSFELWALKELSKMSPHVRLAVNRSLYVCMCPCMSPCVDYLPICTWTRMCLFVASLVGGWNFGPCFCGSLFSLYILWLSAIGDACSSVYVRMYVSVCSFAFKFSQGVYFPPRGGAEARIFGFYNNKQTNKKSNLAADILFHIPGASQQSSSTLGVLWKLPFQYPLLAHAFSIVGLDLCLFKWVGLWSTAEESSRALPEGALPEEHLVSRSWLARS